MSDVERPEDRWDPYRTPFIEVLNSGPQRIYDADHKPNDVRPAGFTPPARRVAEPLLWEGDDS